MGRLFRPAQAKHRLPWRRSDAANVRHPARKNFQRLGELSANLVSELLNRGHRGGNGLAAQRLADLGALRDGMDAGEALDIIWFYLGYAGFFTLVDDNGWTYQKPEQWLCTAVSQALLKPSQRQKRSTITEETTRKASARGRLNP
jgi:hypothetical protein